MKEKGTALKVAFDSNYSPFSEYTEGEGRGLLVDLWHSISRNAGMELQPVFGVWNDALEAVLSGSADVHSGMLRSPEREEHFAFSVGLFSISAFLFVRSDEHGSRLHDFASRTIGAVAGSHEYEYLRTQYPELSVTLYDSNQLLLAAAVAGDIPAIAADYPVAKRILSHMSREHSLRPVEHLYTRSLRAAVPWSQRGMLPVINTAIEAVSPEEIEELTVTHMPDVGSELLPDWLIPTALAGGAVLSVSYLTEMVNRLVREREQLSRRLEQSKYWRDELEHRLSHLAGSIPGFVYRCRADDRWTVEYISDGCKHLTGFEQADFVDRPDPPGLADFVHEEDLEWLHGMVQDSLRDGSLIDAEYRLIDRYGKQRWVLEHARAVRDEEGTVRFLEGLVTDITARKDAEALANENARLQRLIGEVTFELVSAVPENLDERLGAVLSRIVLGMGARRAYLMSPDEHLNAFRLTHSWRNDGEQQPPSYLVHSDYPDQFASLADGEPVSLVREQPEDGEGSKVTVWWCPIMESGLCRGLLGVDASYVEDGFAEVEEATLRIIINLVSEALQRIDLQEKLKHQSITDPLTGVYNRRFFEQRISVAEDEYRREGRNSAVIMLDLDRFKELNDTYGHHIGDSVLRSFTETVSDEVRPSDVFARYGGEEFVVLLASTGVKEAQRVAERIRARVAGVEVPVSGDIVRYTVSAGVAATDEPGERTPAALLSRSDGRLYMAKSAGRNTVVGRE